MISNNVSTYQLAAKELEKIVSNLANKEHWGNSYQKGHHGTVAFGWDYWNHSQEGAQQNIYITDCSSTIIVEIEAILNDRPLTYTSTDLDDPEPLWPSHFL